MAIRMTIITVIFTTLFGSAIVFDSIHDARAEEKKNEVKELMIAAHKAPKGKTSPLQKLQAELKSDTPDWKAISENLKPLSKLAFVIKDKEFGYRGPTKPYVDAVALLKKSASETDLTKGRAAIMAISQSCASCHR